jgi:hypothetical protein
MNTTEPPLSSGIGENKTAAVEHEDHEEMNRNDIQKRQLEKKFLAFFS